jgi:bifunctional enzyme CysN/CysC
MSSNSVITSIEQKLRIVIVGHVDHGKSTLIGRLFYDTNSLPEGKVEAIQKACEAEGMEFEYAFLLDALLEEQSQNITIDTTQIHFQTVKRSCVIIDAPGHKEFLKNMITGAASADAAILLIDAKEGVQEQSRRHGYLLSLLGIKQVIVAVNKMDLVDYKEDVFKKVSDEFIKFLEPLGVKPAHIIPIAAKHGENISSKSEKMKWHKGSHLLQALDDFQPPASKDQLPLRLNVQDIYRFDHRRIIAGSVISGALKIGDELFFYPEGKSSRIKSIETYGDTKTPSQLEAEQPAAITLEEQIFVERGQIASHKISAPHRSREFKARLFWLHDEPLKKNSWTTLKLGTQTTDARINQIHFVMDSSTLQRVTQSCQEIQKNEVAEVTVYCRRDLAFDTSQTNAETGRFVLYQGARIGGGGIITAAVSVDSKNLSWTEGEVSGWLRARHFGHRSAVIWMTGLSGSGKSTLSVNLESQLFQQGVSAFILDGDNLRRGLCQDLEFSDNDRRENIRRAGEVARLVAESGSVVIASLISPFAKDRELVREICKKSGILFFEVYVNAPLAVCEQRDPKQLYSKARNGQIKRFTGIDSPYEPPTAPELELKTDQSTLEECVQAILDFIMPKIHFNAVAFDEAQEPASII